MDQPMKTGIAKNVDMELTNRVTDMVYREQGKHTQYKIDTVLNRYA